MCPSMVTGTACPFCLLHPLPCPGPAAHTSQLPQKSLPPFPHGPKAAARSRWHQAMAEGSDLPLHLHWISNWKFYFSQKEKLLPHAGTGLDNKLTCAFIRHWDIKDFFKWDIVLFPAEGQHCCPDTSKVIYALLPLGEKSPKPIPVATSNP